MKQAIKGHQAMLARTPIRPRSTLGVCRFLAGGFTGAMAMIAIIMGLGMSDLTARTGLDPAGQIVNRSLKGDRLPLRPAFRLDAGRPPAELKARTATPDAKLPDGCEALVSSIANSDLAHIAGHCIS
jgi:hypothetical protein